MYETAERQYISRQHGSLFECLGFLSSILAAPSVLAAMGDSPVGGRYSYSPSPRHGRSRSRSPPPYRGSSYRDRDGRDDGRDIRDIRDGPVTEEIASNPGNNLYVTGLSTRVTEKDLEDYFSREGKVVECRLVVDPRTRESRGFGFVTMDSVEDADRCVKRLHQSNLEGRIITVEKARRKRARTPTPGKYLGTRSATGRPLGGRRHDDYRDDYHRGGSYRSSSRRSPRYSPYRRSPDYSPYAHRRDYERSPEYSPYRGRRERDRSPPPYYHRN